MNTNPQTLVVVMPVYNSQATLSMAIESILGQSYRNLRLVIVDDASEDESLDIARSFMHDSRVVVLQNKENRGAYYSRNAGLDFFKDMNWGYFTTHDADDISYKHRYFKMITLMKRPRVFAVQDTFRKIDLKTTTVIESKLTMAHAMFKREIFKRIGYFEVVRFGADWEYWQRAMAFMKERKMQSVSISETLGDALIHNNNLTVQIPVGSTPRKQYVKHSRKNIAKMVEQGLLYRSFETDYTNTKRFP